MRRADDDGVENRFKQALELLVLLDPIRTHTRLRKYRV